MGYDIAHKLKDINHEYVQQDLKALSKKQQGAIIAYSILSAPKSKTLTELENNFSYLDNHATREFKKRHIEHIRSTVITFSPDMIGWNKPEFAFYELSNNLYGHNNINTLEGLTQKLLFENVLSERTYEFKDDVFNAIAEATIKGSKAYAASARRVNLQGTNWALFKEYNQILKQMQKLLQIQE